MNTKSNKTKQIKKQALTYVLLIGALFMFNGPGCREWPDQHIGNQNLSTAMTGPAFGNAKSPGPKPTPPPAPKSSQNQSQKWQQMIATDINTLQTAEVKTDKKTVHVVAFHPQGQTRSVDAVDEINITFSEPVAPLKKIEKNAPSLITVKPHLDGEGFWKSSTTYTYRIDKKPTLCTRYDVRFKGYTAFTGKTAPPKEWSFTTPTITIRRTKPYHRVKWQTLDQKVLVQFTQNVDPTKIADFITITSPSGNHPFTVRHCTQEERKLLYYYGTDPKVFNRYVVITPQTTFPMASAIQVKFLAGLPSTEGNVGLLKEREMQFRTFEIFKVTRVPEAFRPNEGIEMRFSNPVNIKHAREKISFEPAVEIKPGGSWNTDYVVINGKFMPGTTYTMTMPADLQDQFGNTLGSEQSFKVECMDYRPFLAPPDPNHFVLEDYLEKRIPVSARNVFESPVYYKELDRNDLKMLFDRTYFNLKKMKKEDCNRFMWTLPVKKNYGHVLGFDLEKVNMDRSGFYYIHFEKTKRYYYHGHIFQLTDVALMAKYSPTQVLVVPFDMKTGRLVPGLNFDIEHVSPRSTLKESFSGDHQGLALYEPPLEIIEKNNLIDCFVFSEPRKAFVWGNKQEMYDMWHFTYKYKLNYNNRPRYYYNHLFAFTDKHLYKAGQTVKFKGILRQVLGGEMKTPGVKKVKVQVFDSRDKSVTKLVIDGANVTEYGSFAGEFRLPDKAPSGFYRIRLEGTLDKTSVSREVTFSVQEYKPAKFEVKVLFDQQTLVAGRDFSGHVNGRYLFGTPMKKADGNCTWTIEHHRFSPPGWDQYTFGTPDSIRRETIFKQKIQLDDEGNFAFSKAPLTLPGKNSARLTVYGEARDKDNHRLSGSRSMVVHRGEYYIGLKSGSYFFKQGKPGKIMVVAVTPGGKPVDQATLNLNIIREEWKSFQQKDASGALRWKWQKLTEDVLKETLSLPKGQLEKEYVFDKPGYYRVTLEGRDALNNTITTSGNFYVTGSGYVSWGVGEGRIIDLETDKNQYRPGDTIELLIKSPFETATALVTVEREKVMWSRVVQLVGNAQTVKIPVVKDFMPNAYINVTILKERTGLTFDDEGNDTGKPEFYVGYKAVSVDAGEKKLSVEVTAHRESYEPGEEVVLDIRVRDRDGAPVKAEVCLSVVDKGVLNLVGYQLPDPFAFFWKDRPLDVRTVSTLSDVLGRRLFKEKGEAPGGDGGGAAYGSVVVRKNFKESAFYTAFVETGDKGDARLTFTLPDNITTFKAMAVAGTVKDTFGRGSRDILVKKSLILKPAVPDFSRPGDRYSAGVTVTNNAGKKLTATVDVRYKNVGRGKGDPDRKKVTLGAGETRAVWFDFEVTGTETQELTFRARSGRFSDGLYQEIPVRLPRFLEAAANYGRVGDQPVKERIIVPEGTLRQLDRAEITLASSAMVGIKRNFEVLQEYPYDCLEQRISKQYPLLGAGDFLLTYGLLDMDRKAIDKRIKELLEKMPAYQAGGGFKYYPQCIFPSTWLTCYATEFLLDAKAKGYPVDRYMLEGALGFLKLVARSEVDFKYPYSRNIGLLVQSYAVYVLARGNVFMGDAVNNLFEVRDRIPFAGLAYLVKTLDLKHKLPAYMQPVLAKTMLNKMKDEPTMAHFENHEDRGWWWVHGSNVKTTAIVLETFLKVYGRFPQAEKIARWLTRTTVQKRHMSTQEHIRMFMAFERYYRVFEEETPDFVARVLMTGLPAVEETFSGRQLTARTHSLPLAGLEPGRAVDAMFRKSGTGMLYYLLRLKYFPIGEVEAIDRGFKVTKSYRTLAGQPVTDNRFKAGEKYVVDVVVETKMERPFVMLDDPLPAGLRVLNPDFKTTSGYDVEETGVNRDNEKKGYWGNFYRSEIYFDRVQVFADYLRRGTHRWSYLVIAANGGDFSVPNTVVMEMYNPEVFGRNANRRVGVQ